MRATRALLVAASVLTVACGTTTASQALGWERPWTAHTQSSTLSADVQGHDKEHGKAHGKGKGKGKGDKLVHSCKGGSFGYCTQNAIFAPKILGDIGLTTGLIGLIDSTNGTNGTDGTNGMTMTDGTTDTTTPPPPSHWCSPGYWRQPQHLDSWAATGYSPSDNFATATGVQATRTPLGVSQGAPTNPTLLQVVDNPQWYGGDDTNRVADLLSAAHPEVNYNPPPFRQAALPCPLN
jgi:hypothetical protein